MADTMVFALLGSLLVLADAAAGAVRVVPAQARQGTAQRRSTKRIKRGLRAGARLSALRHPWRRRWSPRPALRRLAAAHAVHRRRVHAAPRRRRALGARDDALHDLVRGGVEARARRCATSCARFPAGDDRRQRARAPRRRHRSDRLLQRRVLRRAEAVRRPSGAAPIRTKPQLDRRRSRRSSRRSPASSSTTRSRPRTRWTRRRPASRARWPSRSSAPTSTTLEQKGEAIKQRPRDGAAASRDVTLVRELGQPSLTIEPDRAKIARYGLNVADINSADRDGRRRRRRRRRSIQGERAVRPRRAAAGAVPREHGGDQEHPGRDARTASTCRSASSPTSRSSKAPSFIYREDNSRFIGVQFSVEGRDLASAVAGRAGSRSTRQVPLPSGYTLRLGRRIQGVHGRRARR